MKLVRVPNNPGVIEGLMGFDVSSIYHAGDEEQDELGRERWRVFR